MLRFRCALIEIVSASGSAARASAGIVRHAFAASAEQNHVVDNNFRHVLFLAGLFVVPRMGSQAAFDVNLAAFFQVLASDLRSACPCSNVVPLGAILPLAIFILEALVSGKRELGYRRSAGGVFKFRILAQISNKNDFVDAFSCHKCCSLRLLARDEREEFRAGGQSYQKRMRLWPQRRCSRKEVGPK